MVFRVEGEPTGVAKDGCGDGASDERAGDIALAVVSERRLKPVPPLGPETGKNGPTPPISAVYRELLVTL